MEISSHSFIKEHHNSLQSHKCYCLLRQKNHFISNTAFHNSLRRLNVHETKPPLIISSSLTNRHCAKNWQMTRAKKRRMKLLVPDKRRLAQQLTARNLARKMLLLATAAEIISWIWGTQFGTERWSVSEVIFIVGDQLSGKSNFL